MIIHIDNEWDKLIATMLVAPTYFSQTQPINLTQVRYFGTALAPNATQVALEHAEIVRLLTERGIVCQIISPEPTLPYQFNIRDAAIVVDQTIYLARMLKPIRQEEPEVIRKHLSDANVQTVRLGDGMIEGGDVVVLPKRILVGLSERTNKAGAESLSSHLSKYRQVEMVPLAPGVLHLDVALSCPTPSISIVYRPAFVSGLPQCLQHGNIIDVTDDEYLNQAVNLLPLGENTVLIDQRQQRLIDQLLKYGLECLPCCVDHISRIGGGLRCMTNAFCRNP